MKKVFAFDMGKASIGYCVREDFEIKDLGSLIIDFEHASIENIRKTRRRHRTINSHRAREEYFNTLWTNCGLNPLEKNDSRFTKEFPTKNEDTIYTSCLLRIALLQNKPLEEWQIYKALYSAIQHRGYDASLPWATKDEKKSGEELTKGYTTENDIELIVSDEYKYPCYYDATRLRLWSESSPFEFKKFVPIENVIKVRDKAKSSTRELVTKELSQLWINAQRQIPSLNQYSVEEFLYGEAQIPYASYIKHDFQKYRGKIKDLQGVLSQKVPRFDNRIISKCKLLPKRNVCKSSNLDNIIFTLLMQLKNLRYVNIDRANGNKLTPIEIRTIYENKISKWVTQYNDLKKDKSPDFTITATDIAPVLGMSTKQFNELNKFEKIIANTSGRSSFCKRACQIMNKIILSGELYPQNVDLSEFVDNSTSPNAITKEEIDEMISKVGDWNNLYIPDNRENLFINANDSRQQTDIHIGAITNPIVRNRLQIFRDLLLKLKGKHGTPNEVIFEFIRDNSENSLLSKSKADATKEYYARKYKNNEELKEKHGNNLSKKDLEKLKLLEQQGGRCFYTGSGLAETCIDEYDVDHIYPYSQSHCDALYNKVLCLRRINQKEKGDRTPFEWFKQDKTEGEWISYCERVSHLLEKHPKPKYPKDHKKLKEYYIAKREYDLALKKYLLLTSPPEKCAEIIDVYNPLADTSYIAKIAQNITACVFGFALQVEGENRHIYTTDGTITHKMLNYYGLTKDRSDNRHHAQDAILISFARMFVNEKNKHRSQIIQIVNDNMDNVVPYPYTHKKQLKKDLAPDATTYGKKRIGDKAYITFRVSLETMKQDMKAIKNIIDKDIKEDLTQKLDEKMSLTDWDNMLKNYVHPKKKTKVNKVLTIVSEGTLETDKNGRERIGEYVDFGNKGTRKQFKHSKRHKGQILYYDKKNSIKVMPIYTNKSTKEVKEQLLKMGCKLYNDGEVFHSGCLIVVDNKFNSNNGETNAGKYTIGSIKSTGVVELKGGIRTSVTHLTNSGFRKD